jgi:hypothetical protein
LNILYQPFWCEENIWHLAQHSATAASERLVLVITGAEAPVACWQQKAGVEGAPVLWDYHVVLATRADGWQIWDLDGRAGLPVAAETWLRTTFPCPELVSESYQPRFAVIAADHYLQRFGSDRAHMRDLNGGWLQPPPPWAEIGGLGLSLPDALAQARQGLDLAALEARLNVTHDAHHE